jgi:hypothetical protein
MVCTVPLHQLEANKGRVRDGEFGAYTVWGLAFVAIDTVTVQMDFDRGAAHEVVIEAVLPDARRQAPDRDEAEHREGSTARRLLDDVRPAAALLVDGKRLAQECCASRR